jgi:hypothetical protein
MKRDGIIVWYHYDANKMFTRATLKKFKGTDEELKTIKANAEKQCVENMALKKGFKKFHEFVPLFFEVVSH